MVRCRSLFLQAAAAALYLHTCADALRAGQSAPCKCVNLLRVRALRFLLPQRSVNGPAAPASACLASPRPCCLAAVVVVPVLGPSVRPSLCLGGTPRPAVSSKFIYIAGGLRNRRSSHRSVHRAENTQLARLRAH